MLATTIASSVLIASIALVRRLFRGKLSLRLQYALWLLVAARLLLPLRGVQSPVSVLNLLEQEISLLATEDEARAPWQSVPVPAPGGSVEITQPPPLPGDGSSSAFSPPGKAQSSPPPEQSAPPKNDPGRTLRTIWPLGVVVIGLWFTVQNLSFHVRLRKTRKGLPVSGGRLRVYVSPQVKTPCLFGLSAAVYLPPTRLDKDALAYILAHEETHYRHGDHLWAYLRCLCLTLHWHNPFVWWAAALSRRDCEMACDEGTLSRIGDEHRKAYGNTLIDMIERRVRPSDLLSGATTMSAGMSAIKERITMIAQRPKMLFSTLLVVVSCVALAVSCTFTGPTGVAKEVA